MGRIMWDTDVNAPGCSGEIINMDNEQTILIQTDWDYCGVATSFGWSIWEVQQTDHDECDHSFSDGTVDCPECGLTAGKFIAAARDWLDANGGVEVDDPGYFT